MAKLKRTPRFKSGDRVVITDPAFIEAGIAGTLLIEEGDCFIQYADGAMLGISKEQISLVGKQFVIKRGDFPQFQYIVGKMPNGKTPRFGLRHIAVKYSEAEALAVINAWPDLKLTKHQASR